MAHSYRAGHRPARAAQASQAAAVGPATLEDCSCQVLQLWISRLEAVFVTLSQFFFYDDFD